MLQAGLRSDAEHPRLEGADPVAPSAVARELVVDISDQADVQLLGQKLRGSPIQMPIDAVLIIGVRILEIVSQATHGGEFMSSLRIEIRVAAAGVDGPMTNARFLWLKGEAALIKINVAIFSAISW